MPPTDEELALVREAHEAFNTSGDDLDGYFTRYFTPDGVVELVDGFPISGRYQGIDGYRRFFEDSYAPYADVRRRLDQVTVVGERVVALLTITGREKGEEVELEVQMGNTYEFENGRIRHLCAYLGHDRALEAARTAS